MKRLLAACLLASLALPLSGARADFPAPPILQQGPPPLPANFNGTIRVADASAPEGSHVSAWVNGHRAARDAVKFYEPQGSVYVLNVAGDDQTTPALDGGTSGAEVYFVLELAGGGSVYLTPRAVWVSGAITSLDLSFSPAVVLPLIVINR